MKIADLDYRISKSDKFIVESSIIKSLWDEKLINNFHKNLSSILDEIYEKSNRTFSHSKKLISLSFSGDRKITELNNSYRKINLATNVLSFPSYLNQNNELFIGDIIFSIETICKEAKRDNKSINNHLIHLFVHGVLHLLGYDHKTEAEAKKMENLEIRILETLKIDNPYKII